MFFLKQADVHILDINSMTFTVNTTQDAYERTRTILLTLKEQCALPLHLNSEDVSEAFKPNYSSGTIFEKDLPPRWGNSFQVSGHKLVGKDREKILALAKQVAQRLEGFGLSVIVHE
jgi:hypothetical protein